MAISFVHARIITIQITSWGKYFLQKNPKKTNHFLVMFLLEAL
jgi:hypothetical protein